MAVKMTDVAKVKWDQTEMFAQRLRWVRLASGFTTVREFAKRIGVEEDTYAWYERGRSFPNPMTLGRIRQLTGATVDYLYYGDESGISVGLMRAIDAVRDQTS